MQIALFADDSVRSAPAGFTAAIQAAASVFEQDIPGNYTVNLSYGWGTFDNEPDTDLTPANSSYFSVGGPDQEDDFTYNQVKNLLSGAATTSSQITAVASLPSSSPNSSQYYALSSSQEKALGIYTGYNGAVDGSIGFNTDDVSGGVLSPQTEGAALAEIAHALGLLSGYGSEKYALDLYRYASPGVYATNDRQPAYLSIDGGRTDLANYDTSGFDPTLFVNLPNDPFSLDAIGTQSSLTKLDLEDLSLMGFAGTSNLFGTLTHDPTSPAGEITELYQTILGRPSDSGGLAHYTSDVADGTPIASIAQDMIASAEYASDYGSSTQSNSEFVTQLYLDGLHRQPDSGGLAGYDYALANGVSRAQVAVDIATSPESQRDLSSTFQAGVTVPDATDVAIAQLYYGLLDRGPDGIGLAREEVFVAQGGSLQDVASDFINSPEYNALHGQQTNTQFITALYSGALGRTPDVDGLSTYLSELNGGASRASVALQVVESPEANAHLAPLIQSNYNLA